MAWKWDPERGSRMPLADSNSEIHISLKPLESFLLVLETGESEGGSAYPQVKQAVEELIIQSDWTAEFYPVDGKSFTRTFKDLIDLKESDDPLLQNFAGDIHYKARFDALESNFSSLDLGEVNDGVTKVILNGMSLGKKWYGKHVYEVGSQLRLGPNEIEIVYTSLLSNYCRSIDKVEAQRWIGDRELISNGITGPVVFK